MYNGIKVLDIHGHYSAPATNGGAAVALMLASNTPLKDDPRKDIPRFGMSEQASSARAHFSCSAGCRSISWIAGAASSIT